MSYNNYNKYNNGWNYGFGSLCLLETNYIGTEYYYYCTIFLSIPLIIIRVSLSTLDFEKWSLSEQQKVNENNRLSYDNNGWNYGFGSLCLLNELYWDEILLLLLLYNFSFNSFSYNNTYNNTSLSTLEKWSLSEQREVNENNGITDLDPSVYSKRTILGRDIIIIIIIIV